MMALAMRATRPTTRSSHSFAHFINANFDASLSGFGFLGGTNPTNPFVASQWGERFPKSIRQAISDDCFLKVIWKFVRNIRKASL